MSTAGAISPAIEWIEQNPCSPGRLTLCDIASSDEDDGMPGVVIDIAYGAIDVADGTGCHTVLPMFEAKLLHAFTTGPYDT